LVWEGGINKAEGLDVGPLSASSEGDPQYPQKKGREIIPKGPLSFLGKEMTLQKRDWNKGDKIERTKWGKRIWESGGLEERSKQFVMK
jgi:hypothetical protein